MSELLLIAFRVSMVAVIVPAGLGMLWEAALAC